MSVDRTFLDGLPDTMDDEQEYTPPSNFVPPPQPSTLRVILFDIAEANEVQGVLNATLTYKITGGEYDDRELQFQRVSSKTYTRGKGVASSLDDVLWAGKCPSARNVKDKATALFNLMEAATPFEIVWGWRAFCSNCYEKGLIEATGIEDAADAKKRSTAAQRKTASKAATIPGGSKAFPLVDGKRIPVVACPKCSTKENPVEVRAQGNIIAYKQVKGEHVNGELTPF